MPGRDESESSAFFAGDETSMLSRRTTRNRVRNANRSAVVRTPVAECREQPLCSRQYFHITLARALSG
jgi:hypothetical protein